MNLFHDAAQPGWLCPHTYHRDELGQLIHRRGADHQFFYSDGAASERWLHRVLAGARDLSTGSESLSEAIRDWPSAYHLSAQRADLLRPIAEILRGNTLEIGAGCGAITRFLGEQGGRVIALEGSLTRAKLARLRCRGLQNVDIVVDNFQSAAFMAPFDLITLIGVLEYSPKYIDAPDPVGFVLNRARDLLTPDGALVIAIENQMGLKYLSGAPEDHHDVPFLGVEDRYAGTAVTFGRLALEALLQKHGFVDCRFLYPFGDYKMPSCIINQACADASDPFINDLIRTFARHQPPYAPTFSEELATAVAGRNGLTSHLANSFLVVARTRPAKTPVDTLPRAWAYATSRAKAFAKQTVFTRAGGSWDIRRRRLYDHIPLPDAAVQLRLEDETALPGRLLYEDLLATMNTPGWSITAVARAIEPWLELLLAARKRAEQPGAATELPGSCIDCVPHNIIITLDGRAVAFDQEWSTTLPVALGHVLMRGLGMVLTRPRSLAAAASGTPVRVLTAIHQILSLIGLPVSAEQFEAFCAAEYAFQKASGGHPPEPRETLFYSAGLRLRTGSTQASGVPEGFALTLEQQARLLQPFFDRAYYLKCHPDVRQSGMDPLLHFIAHGDAEGRDPCTWFCTAHYRRRHPDAAKSGWPGLLHYVVLGKHQGRDIAEPPATKTRAEGAGL